MFDFPSWSGVAIPIVVVVLILLYAFRVMREYERAVVFLLGRLWKIKGPGNAAELLGLKPSTLRYRMKKLGITRPAG